MFIHNDRSNRRIQYSIFFVVPFMAQLSPFNCAVSSQKYITNTPRWGCLTPFASYIFHFHFPRQWCRQCFSLYSMGFENGLRKAFVNFLASDWIFGGYIVGCGGENEDGCRPINILLHQFDKMYLNIIWSSMCDVWIVAMYLCITFAMHEFEWNDCDCQSIFIAPAKQFNNIFNLCMNNRVSISVRLYYSSWVWIICWAFLSHWWLLIYLFFFFSKVL